MRAALGTASFSSSRRLPAREFSATVETPVTFPPGREKLATNPLATGSVEMTMMIGIVVVASWAAWMAWPETATIASGRSCTSSRASPGSRSNLSSANRRSPTNFRPSTYRRSRSALGRTFAIVGMEGSGPPPAERIPRRYTLPAACWAWAAMGADNVPSAHTRTKARRSIIERGQVIGERSCQSPWARSIGRVTAQPPVERFVTRHDDLGGEELARTCPRRFAQGSPSGPVVDQALQRPGERPSVAGGNQHAAHSVLYHFGDPAHAGGDARAAEAHGLQDAQA